MDAGTVCILACAVAVIIVCVGFIFAAVAVSNAGAVQKEME